MRVEADGEVLLNVPKFDFNWQPYYYLETPKALPRGTRIECTASFDNSANNRFNPDPTSTIFWGPQSWDEMMIGWLDLAVDRAPEESLSVSAHRGGPDSPANAAPADSGAKARP